MVAPIPQNPIVNAGLKYVNGLEMLPDGTRLFAIAPGAARDSLNINDIILNEQIILSVDKIGVNGLDLAPLVANKVYAIYVIGDSTKYQPTAGIISLDVVHPNLPAGYDMYRRVGWISTDAVPDIRIQWQFGGGQNRQYFYDTSVTVRNSSPVDVTYTNVSLLGVVPPIDTSIIIDCDFVAVAASNVLDFRPPNSLNVAGGLIRTGTAAVGTQVSSLYVPAQVTSLGIPVFKYKGSAGSSVGFSLSGYEDFLD